jgi:CubicO group peptidase (beta-lactamase class C family)
MTNQLPDTAAAHQLAEYLDVFNQADGSALLAFFEQRVTPAAPDDRRPGLRPGEHAMAQWQSRALRELRVVSDEGARLAVIARSPLTDQWRRVTIEVDAGDSRRIRELRLEPVEAPEGARPVRLSDDDLARELAAWLEQLVAAGTFSGTVLLAKAGEPFFEAAHGLASLRFNVPNRIDTKFNLGSMNKMFTAVAIAQLAERGLLRYDVPIGEYLPEWPAEAANSVTIHHLLTHTSGIGDYFNERYFATHGTLRKVDDYLPLFRDDPLEFQPGERFRYSNAGFMLLGKIIEAVSGNDYFEHVRTTVYEPAGMFNTDAYEMDLPVPNLAIGYTQIGAGMRFVPGPWRSNHFLHVIKGGPAGGGFSTAHDLLSFDRALRGQKLLSPEATDLVTTGKVAAWDERDLYAYGFGDRRVDGQRIVGHGGGFAGINANLDMYLDSGYSVVVMSNYDPPAASQVAEWVRRRIGG